MSRKKKTMLFILLCMSSILSSFSVFAQSENNENVGSEIISTWTLQGENEEKESYNVSEEMPIRSLDVGITVYGIGFPERDNCIDLSKNGRYNFSGEAQISDLFTNKCFTGKSKYNVSVMNYKKDETMKVKLMKFIGIGATAVHTQTIHANGGVAYTIYNLDSSAKYFLKFEGPSDFSGYIE